MALIRQFSAGVILVNFLNQSVDLSNALLRFFQFPTFCRELLFLTCSNVMHTDGKV